MPRHRLAIRPKPSVVQVLESSRILDDYFKVDRARIRVEQYDGRMSPPMTRLVFERGDAVAVLLYDPQERSVILIQQFRYPAYVRDPQHGWLWELVAGVQEEGESPEEVARREAWEEAGYVLESLSYVLTVYPSPGGSSERIHLFVAPVTPRQCAGRGGGVPEAGEDILVRSFALDEALGMVERGEIMNALTVIALQHLALHWDRIAS